MCVCSCKSGTVSARICFFANGVRTFLRSEEILAAPRCSSQLSHYILGGRLKFGGKVSIEVGFRFGLESGFEFSCANKWKMNGRQHKSPGKKSADLT